MNQVRARWRVIAGGVLIAGVAGCHSPTRQEQMQAAQDDLVHEAVALQQCEASKGYSSGQCTGQRQDYERDLAAFRAKYGK